MESEVIKVSPNDRVKQLRIALDMSQEEMGKRLGVTRGAVCKIEIGDRKLTEQMAKSICREFRVNYFWLMKGLGDIFIGTPDSVLDEIAEDYDLDEIDKKIIKSYLELDTDKRKVLKEYLKNLFT